MTSRRAEGEATRRRILTTAERLFAARGIDAVSIRDITGAAKVNTAAIHYHFGAKRDLVAAIIERRAAEVGARRAGMLDVIEAQHPPTIRQIAEALVLPIAGIWAESPGGRNYTAFMAAVVDHPECAKLVTAVFDEHSVRLLQAFKEASPTLDPEVAAFRYALARSLLTQAFGRQRTRIERWVDHHYPGDGGDYVTRVVDFVAGALGAPAST